MTLTSAEIKMIIDSLYNMMNDQTDNNLQNLPADIPCMGNVLVNLVQTQSPYLSLANKFAAALKTMSEGKS